MSVIKNLKVPPYLFFVGDGAAGVVVADGAAGVIVADGAADDVVADGATEVAGLDAVTDCEVGTGVAEVGVDAYDLVDCGLEHAVKMTIKPIATKRIKSVRLIMPATCTVFLRLVLNFGRCLFTTRFTLLFIFVMILCNMFLVTSVDLHCITSF